MLSEQGFLRASIIATVVVATLGIAFGLLSGSFSGALGLQPDREAGAQRAWQPLQHGFLAS